MIVASVAGRDVAKSKHTGCELGRYIAQQRRRGTIMQMTLIVAAVRHRYFTRLGMKLLPSFCKFYTLEDFNIPRCLKRGV